MSPVSEEEDHDQNRRKIRRRQGHPQPSTLTVVVEPLYPFPRQSPQAPSLLLSFQFFPSGSRWWPRAPTFQYWTLPSPDKLASPS
eukprot:9331387-Prorocentrum_lima.AAC.1